MILVADALNTGGELRGRERNELGGVGALENSVPRGLRKGPRRGHPFSDLDGRIRQTGGFDPSKALRRSAAK